MKVFITQVQLELLPPVKAGQIAKKKGITKTICIVVREDKLNLESLNLEYVNRACVAAGVIPKKGYRIISFTKLKEANGIEAFRLEVTG